MDIKTYEEYIPYIIIDDLYDSDQLNSIWREFDFLFDKLNSQDESTERVLKGALNYDGSMLRNSKNICLDEIYPHRNISDILTYNRKFFDNWHLIFGEGKTWWIQCIKDSSPVLSRDSTVFSYMEDNGYYGAHKDDTYITTCTWFYQEPKGFIGGDLILNPNNSGIGKQLNKLYPSIPIEIKNNRMVVFPGCITHQVLPVKLKDECKGMKGMGRFCITNFINNT
jgi:hypothetical protein